MYYFSNYQHSGNDAKQEETFHQAKLPVLFPDLTHVTTSH